MRLGRLKSLFSLQKFNKLRQDFTTPFKALLAASGVTNKKITLQTHSGQKLDVDRGDLPIWKAYFGSPYCSIKIKQGMFHILPNNHSHPDYFIKGGHATFTWQARRWVKHQAPLLRELEAAEKSVYSQHGEDGVIQALLKEIPPGNQFIVEFGAYDGECMSNSRHLICDHNWQALLIEPDPRFFARLEHLYAKNDRVKTVQAFITTENINQLFADAEVPKKFDVLSIDVDGPDYYLWQALTDYQPAIVLLEYNASIPPDKKYIVPEEQAWKLSGTAREGASILALYELGLQKGYRLIYSELSGANLFFIHESLVENFDLTGLTPDALYQTPQFGELAGGAAPNGRGYADNRK